MSKKDIKCPYCKSIDIEGCDTISNDCDINGGYDLSNYWCNHCDEYFYVETILKVEKIDVRKTKY